MSVRQPKHWKVVYDTIESFRRDHIAPVDTMGCSCIAISHDPPSVQRFHTLLGLMLSSQTRDEITAGAMRRLQQLHSSFSPKDAISLSEEELSNLIKPVSFYKRKAKYILSVSRILLDEYRGDIPFTFEELVSLPGVGPKMANLCMQVAWNNSVGIGVDTHMHRICNRLGWVNTTSPMMTQKMLEEWLPEDHWSDINKMLVGFGQLICTAKNPHCHECPVSSFCPYYENHYK